MSGKFVVIPFREWEEINERIKRDEKQLKDIYDALAFLQPAQDAPEWGMDLIDICIKRLKNAQGNE